MHDKLSIFPAFTAARIVKHHRFATSTIQYFCVRRNRQRRKTFTLIDTEIVYAFSSCIDELLYEYTWRTYNLIAIQKVTRFGEQNRTEQNRTERYIYPTERAANELIL